MAQSEVTKLKNHLSLLKQEYTKLQERYNDIEKKYNVLSASSGGISNNTFASRLLNYVKSLYDSEVYSDIKIKVADRYINAHKLILSARLDLWSEDVLKDLKVIDWSDVDTEVSEAIVLWLYTDDIQLKSDELTIKIIRKAHEFKLHGLLEKCEQNLISNVSVRNCVKFYSVAEEIDANNLREYCSGIISAHWDDLDSSDFEHMSGPLLYKMLKSKTQLPLHSAVKLQREDVVFLCLVENASKGSPCLLLIIRSHNSDSFHANLLENQNMRWVRIFQHGIDTSRADVLHCKRLIEDLVVKVKGERK